MHYVIAYDVESNKRRTKIANKLKDHGTRVQFSVFELESDEPRLRQLVTELRNLMQPRTDRLHVYRLCESCYLRSDAFESNTATKKWEG